MEEAVVEEGVRIIMLPSFTRLSLKQAEGRRIHALFQRLEFTEFLQDMSAEIF